MIGEILRKKREELGLDLKQVAHSLRIQYEYLKALENNSIEKLPPEVYTRGYIREYARFLDVDPEPLVTEYAEGQSKQEERIKPALAPAPVKKEFSLRPAILLMPLIAALVLIIIIYFPKSQPAPPAPASEQSQAAPLAVAPKSLPLTKHSQNAPSAVAPQLLPATEPGKVTPLPSSLKKRYVLDAHAIESTWLRVEMDDGKSEEVFMRPSETRKWTSQNGFDIKLGNAGGVKLVLNGKDLGTPGEKGQVLRLRLPQDRPSQQSVGDGRIDNIRPGM